MRIPALFLAALFLAPLAGRADDLLTPTQIATMERRGWITPAIRRALAWAGCSWAIPTALGW